MRRFLVTLALAGVLTTSLAGCAVDGQSSSTGSNAAYDMNDIMFAQMMIPHHEQAVELATIAESNTANPVILDLADRIKSAQQPEIDQMQGWLDTSGSGMDTGHSMHMPGTVSDDDMATIRNARDAEFDALFLTHMIAHHEGAITMAQDVYGTTTRDDVTRLAEAIIAAQTAEIAEMKALLDQ
jgi:uncharacterized protein (DUF305 family)